MKELLSELLNPNGLDSGRACNALTQLALPGTPPEIIAAFVSAIEARGLTQPEFVGFITALKASAHHVDLGPDSIIDVCGTGGDGKHTFNISTASAFVLAGAGIKVAKHGNTSFSSKCGSSDVLKHLGVGFTSDETILRKAISAAGIAYLHAPLFQPTLKGIGAVRAALGFRTFFNLLGPLINPARPKHQFVGVATPIVLRQYRYYLESTDARYAAVHSRDGYDEISLTGPFDVVTNSGLKTISPEDLGIPRLSPSDLEGGATTEESARILLDILRGECTPSQRAVSVVNAAFAMQVVTELSLAECIARAEASIDSGEAFRRLTELIKITKEVSS